MVFDREHCLDKFRYETLRKKKKTSWAGKFQYRCFLGKDTLFCIFIRRKKYEKNVSII